MRNNRSLALIVTALLVPVAFAGCVENVQDLKDRVAGAEESVGVAGDALADAGDQLESAAAELPATNVTVPKPPVARASVFGENGALLFKSSFAADETQIPTVLDGGSTVTFSASDSESVDARATLATYTWTIAPVKTAAKAAGGDGHEHAHSPVPGVDTLDEGHDHGGAAAPAGGAETLTGVSVQHTLPKEGGLFTVTLHVKDTLGGEDAQILLLGVNPAKVVRSVTYRDMVMGANGLPEQAAEKSHVFNISGAIDEMHAVAEKAVFTFAAESPGAVDLALTLRDPAGTSAATADVDSTTELANLVAGDWTAVVTANTAVKGDYALTIEVTYQPHHPDVMDVFGMGGDGHGHAH